MKKFRVLAAALAASAMLAACGGSGPGDQTPRVTYGKMVNFGDSLSDVGTYRVGVVAAQGGGYYSINPPAADISTTLTNWTEYLAAQLQVPRPCAAVTGLNSAPALGGPVPRTAHANCYDWAQGGSRVTNPVGPGNIALLPNDPSAAIGQLTEPVVTQIGNHIATQAAAGQPAFASDDLVTVFAGGNDLFIALATFSATVGAGGDPTAAGQAAVGAMVTAADDLANDVQTKILANGATHVIVVNLPDVSKTPMGLENPTAQPLILSMVQAFNGELATKLPAGANVLFVDAFTGSQQQTNTPEQYGLTNVTDTACDMTKVSSSLVCTKNSVITTADVTFYEYADTVHPTPYGYRLLSQLVAQQMAINGWL
jgi:phospholipase/lecithinase/hemolysin